MSINEEFISVADFALLTGLTPAQIQGRYTVQVGDRKLVPRFMIAGHTLPEVAHIELVPGQTENEEAETEEAETGEILNGSAAPLADLPIYLEGDQEEPAEGEYHPVATIDMPMQHLSEIALQPLALPDLPANVQANQQEEQKQEDYIASLERDAFELDNALSEATQHAINKEGSQLSNNGNQHSGRVFSRSELGLIVHPFSRLVARSVDLTWESVALVFILLGLLQSLDSNLGMLFQTPVALATLGIMIAPLTLLLDAVIYSVFKNTPGKYLMGLRVVSKRLRTLKFSKYLKRNFRMWGRVLGYGIVPLALFYMVREGFRIRRGLETNYDQAGRTRVGKKLNSKSSTFTLAAAAAAALFYALVLGGIVDADSLKDKAATYLPAFLGGNSS